jgi:hypothetical protein
VKLAGSAGADVGRQIRLGSHQAAEMHELLDAELVGLGRIHAGRHAALPIVIGARPSRRFADAVAPMISVGKAAARPAKIGRPNPLHVVDELFADAVHVRDRRVTPHPDAIVDDAAKVLDEVPINLRAGHDGLHHAFLTHHHDTEIIKERLMLCAKQGAGVGLHPDA